MKKKKIDTLIYVVVIAGPIVNLPQLIKIWVERSAEGVSVVSWASFALMSCIWLYYGISYKNIPIIAMNSALILVQTAIAISALAFQ